MNKELQEWIVAIICFFTVLTAIAFVVGYNIGKISYEDNSYDAKYDFLYNETLGDPGEPVRHFDYKNSTRTTCYTINKTCYVEKLGIK